MLWGPVIAGHASLHEVRTKWRIEDCEASAQIVAARAEMEREAYEKARKKD